jgi:hypothetical protein
MNITTNKKINELRNVKYMEKNQEYNIQKDIEFLKRAMGNLPENNIIEFSQKYGFSMFNNCVCINSLEKNGFLSDNKIEIGFIYGFGKHRNNIKEIIETYYIEEQINCKFYPLSEGYPGDVIFYSLENGTLGKIYYWHHEAEIEKQYILISETFEEFINGLYIENGKNNQQLNNQRLKAAGF